MEIDNMINQYLESTNLKTNLNWKDVRSLVKEANDNNFLGVCTYLCWSSVVDKYASSTLKKIYVLGFYVGSPFAILNDLQLLQVCKSADELDLVFPYPAYLTPKGLLQDERGIDLVKKLLDKVREQTKGKVLKVIIETAILRRLEQVESKFEGVIKLCENSGADIIKTNTGMYKREGTLLEDVELIKKFTKLPIKCSGGISSYEDAKKLIDLGQVTRIGTSKALDILKGECQ